MAEPLTDEAARLLASRSRIRALARELVFDSSDVDDVAQDAWIETHAEPHRERTGYLRTMLRGLAANRERSRERRRYREERAAKTEALTSTDELVTEAEAQRKVLDAVLSLREPYRSCVLLRYWGDHQPREIASRLDIPVETVRTRLKRAMAELRMRLDRDFGERTRWRSAFVPLIVPSGSRIGTWLGFGGLFVSTTSKTLVSLAAIVIAVLLLLGGIELWPFGGEPPSRTDVTIATDASKPRVDANELPMFVAGSKAPSEQPPSAPAFDATMGILLYGVVRHEDESPVDSCRVWLAGDDGNRPMAQFGKNGAYSAVGLTPGNWTLHADQDGYQPVETPIELDGTPHVRHDITLRPSLRLRVAIVTPDGIPFAPELAGAPEHAAGTDFDITAVATSSAPGAFLPGVTHGTASRHGVGTFTTRTHRSPLPELAERYIGYLEIRAPLPVYVSAVVGGAVLETVLVDHAVDELEIVVPNDVYRSALGGLRLRVIDRETRRPLAGIGIGHGHAGRSSHGRKTDADGVFELAPIPPSVIDIDILTKDYEWLRRHFRIRPGETHEATIELSPSRRISGRIIEADGSVSSRYFTLLTPRHIHLPYDADPRTSWQTDVEGRFEVETVGHAPVLVVVHDGIASYPLPVDASSADLENLELRLKTPIPVSISVDPPLPPGFGIAIADELGRPFALPYGSRSARIELPPGRYEAQCYEDEVVHHRVRFVVSERDEVCRVSLPGVAR